MRRILIIALVFIMALFTIVSCGGGGNNNDSSSERTPRPESSETNDPTPEPTPEPTPTPTPEPKVEEIIIKLREANITDEKLIEMVNSGEIPQNVTDLDFINEQDK